VSGSSYKHYYESLASTALGEDRPVSTHATLTTIDNTLHLVDSSPVYRINWVDNVGIPIPQVIIVPDTLNLAVLVLTHQFPATIVREWQYTNYDVRIATSTSSSTLLVYAAITNPHASNSTADGNVLGSFLQAATNSTPAWTIDGRISLGSINRNGNVELVSEYRPNTEVGVGHEGKPGTAQIVWAQLQIAMLAEFSGAVEDNSAKLYGIQVREYVNDD
jgi:hypothetical protein